MLASTIQFTNTPRPPRHIEPATSAPTPRNPRRTPPPAPGGRGHPARGGKPGNTTGPEQQKPVWRTVPAPSKDTSTPHPARGRCAGRACFLRTQQRADPPHPPHHHHAMRRSSQVRGRGVLSMTFPPMSAPHPARSAGLAATRRGTAHYRRPGVMMLLRKEVIQPHLPVRLPCYDFVPIASPTFDRSLP